MDEKIANDQVTGVDPWTAAVTKELAAHPPVYEKQMADGMTLAVQPGRESFWVLVRGASGGIAFRTAYAPGTDFAFSGSSSRRQRSPVLLDCPKRQV